MPTNMVLRKLFIHVGKFSYKSPDMSGAKQLIEEAAVNAKIISGSTSIPIQFFGFGDVMNRSVAETLTESITAGTITEKVILETLWNNVLVKSIKLYNDNSGKTNLPLNKISINIANNNKGQIDLINQIYLPSVLNGMISKRGFLEQIPGIDTELELERLADEAGNVNITDKNIGFIGDK